MRAELSVRCHHFRGAKGTGIITDRILTSIKMLEINVSDVIEKVGLGPDGLVPSIAVRAGVQSARSTGLNERQ
jgi:hypothetical protein